MTTSRVTADELDHHPARVLRLARQTDMIVETCGQPTAVVLSYDRHLELVGEGVTPMQPIADDTAAEVCLEVPRSRGGGHAGATRPDLPR